MIVECVIVLFCAWAGLVSPQFTSPVFYRTFSNGCITADIRTEDDCPLVGGKTQWSKAVKSAESDTRFRPITVDSEKCFQKMSVQTQECSSVSDCVMTTYKYNLPKAPKNVDPTKCANEWSIETKCQANGPGGKNTKAVYSHCFNRGTRPFCEIKFKSCEPKKCFKWTKYQRQCYAECNTTSFAGVAMQFVRQCQECDGGIVDVELCKGGKASSIQLRRCVSRSRARAKAPDCEIPTTTSTMTSPMMSPATTETTTAHTTTQNTTEATTTLASTPSPTSEGPTTQETTASDSTPSKRRKRPPVAVTTEATTKRTRKTTLATTTKRARTRKTRKTTPVTTQTTTKRTRKTTPEATTTSSTTTTTKRTRKTTPKTTTTPPPPTTKRTRKTTPKTTTTPPPTTTKRARKTTTKATTTTPPPPTKRNRKTTLKTTTNDPTSSDQTTSEGSTTSPASPTTANKPKTNDKATKNPSTTKPKPSKNTKKVGPRILLPSEETTSAPPQTTTNKTVGVLPAGYDSADDKFDLITIAGGAGAGFVFIFLIVIIIVLLVKRKDNNKSSPQASVTSSSLNRSKNSKKSAIVESSSFRIATWIRERPTIPRGSTSSSVSDVSDAEYWKIGESSEENTIPYAPNQQSESTDPTVPDVVKTASVDRTDEHIYDEVAFGDIEDMRATSSRTATPRKSRHVSMNSSQSEPVAGSIEWPNSESAIYAVVQKARKMERNSKKKSFDSNSSESRRKIAARHSASVTRLNGHQLREGVLQIDFDEKEGLRCKLSDSNVYMNMEETELPQAV